MAQEGSDIEWLALENKVRKLVKELIEPTVRRVVEDRDQLQKLLKDTDNTKRKADELDFVMAKVTKKLGSLDEVAKRQLDLEVGQKTVEAKLIQTGQSLRAEMELLTADIQRKADFIQNFDKRIEGFNSDITGFDTKFAEAQESLKSLLEERYLSFTAEVTALTETQTAHREVTDGLLAQQKLFNQQAGQIEAELLTQQTALNALRGRMDTVELDRALKTTVAKLSEELERVRNKTISEKDTNSKKLRALKSDLETRVNYQTQIGTINWLKDVLDSKGLRKLTEREVATYPVWLGTTEFPEDLRPQVKSALELARQEGLKSKEKSAEALESNSSRSRSSSPSRKRRSKAPSKLDTEDAPPKAPSTRHHAGKSPAKLEPITTKHDPRKSDVTDRKSPSGKSQKSVKAEVRLTEPALKVETWSRADSTEVKSPSKPEVRPSVQSTDTRSIPKQSPFKQEPETRTNPRPADPQFKPEVMDVRSNSRSIEPQFRPESIDLRPLPRPTEPLPPLEKVSRGNIFSTREELNPTPQFHQIDPVDLPQVPSIQELRQPSRDLGDEQTTRRTMADTARPEVLESEREDQESHLSRVRDQSEAESQSVRRQESLQKDSESQEESDESVSRLPSIPAQESQRPETKSSIYSAQAQEFVAYFTDDSGESVQSERPDLSEIRGELQALSERINTEVTVLRDEMSDRYADFVKDIRQNTEACNALSRQVLSECASLHSLRKREKNDLQKELVSMQSEVESVTKQNEAYLSAVERLAELLAHIVEFCRIGLALCTQDEEDRESIALMGYKEAQSPTSEKPPVVSLDKTCLSCTGQSSIVISAFKMACLAYAPTPLTYRSATFQRKELLDIQRRVLESAWTKANALDPWSRLKLGDMVGELSAYEVQSNKQSPTSWGTPMPPVFAESAELETKPSERLPALPKASPSSFRRRK